MRGNRVKRLTDIQKALVINEAVQKMIREQLKEEEAVEAALLRQKGHSTDDGRQTISADVYVRLVEATRLQHDQLILLVS